MLGSVHEVFCSMNLHLAPPNLDFISASVMDLLLGVTPTSQVFVNDHYFLLILLSFHNF